MLKLIYMNIKDESYPGQRHLCSLDQVWNASFCIHKVLVWWCNVPFREVYTWAMEAIPRRRCSIYATSMISPLVHILELQVNKSWWQIAIEIQVVPFRTIFSWPTRVFINVLQFLSKPSTNTSDNIVVTKSKNRQICLTIFSRYGILLATSILAASPSVWLMR